MYDRLVIPYPPDDRRGKWKIQGWQPDRLDSILEILRTSSEDPKRHAIIVPWGEQAEFIFQEKRRAETAKFVDDDANFRTSASILALDLLPPPPKGVIPVAVVANYPTVEDAETEWVPNNPNERREKLTLALAHQFLVPDPGSMDELEVLKEAVGLADDEEFRRKRAQMYKWQDDIIASGIPDKQALDEMDQYIEEYNGLTQKATNKVIKKYAFTFVPIGLSIVEAFVAMHGGTHIGAMTPMAATSAIAGLAKYWIFDRKPEIPIRDCQAAAMLHTAQEQLGWKVANR